MSEKTHAKITKAISRLKAQREAYQTQIDNPKFMYSVDNTYAKMIAFDLAIEIVEDATR